MRILVCHNYYQVPGGEDSCFEEEADLLVKHGHTVVRYVKDNDGIGGAAAALVAAKAIWNPTTYREVGEIIRQQNIDLVHCTNTFPVISPSIYYACRRARVPVVQSLQNYRLFCANSYFMRDGRVCEDCFGKRLPVAAIRHSCYRDSRLGSVAVASMQVIHHAVGSWRRRVDRFVVNTEFAKQKFIDGGLPAERIAIKPNFVDPPPEPSFDAGDYALFAGRLSKEKGIDAMLAAWQDERCHLPLKIVGDGPMRQQVEAVAKVNPKIEYLGFQSRPEVQKLMRGARFTLVPSLWYEGMPRTIIESLAVGTPIIASNLGALSSIVRPDGGGVLVEPGSAASLAEAAARLCADVEAARALRHLARREFNEKFTATNNYRLLLAIYCDAYRNCHGHDPSPDWVS